MHFHARLKWSPILAFLAVVCAAVTAAETHAAEFKAGAITVEQPWSRATPGGAQVGSGYLTIKNSGDSPDRLVSASTEVAARTEIHEMSMAGGIMKMRELTEGVPVPGQGSVTLEPGAIHLMLLDLKRPLKEGESLAGTLNFERAGTVNVTFEVKGIGAAAPMPGDHHQ
jgi:copper(I)-binding protein